jgi:hypothetical protein
MDNPGAWHLMQTVRKIKEVSQGAQSGAPSADDYLRAVASDPTTEWFTELLREKNEELTTERERADRLAGALRAWYQKREHSADEAELQMVNLLREMKILNP